MLSKKIRKLYIDFKKQIKKNDRLYVILKCIMNSNDPQLVSLIRGYYCQPYKSLTLMLNTPMDAEKESIYYVNFGVDKTRTEGFCALLRYTISALPVADSLGLIPFVEWGKGINYYENELESETRNAFLYYFQPVSKINQIQGKQFVCWEPAHVENYRHKKLALYQSVDEEINFFAESYKKYIHLNKKTTDYIEENIKSVIQDYRVLGVHARGTDFNIGYAKHPKAITPNIYIEKAKKLFDIGNYDKIFIATEDINLLNSFIDTFGEKLVYYDDVFRTSGNVGPHGTKNARPLHHYKLGLEVLRDVYTLAYCDSLLCGMAHVSFAVRYINLALGRNFEELVVLNSEFNDEDSKLAKRVIKQRQEAFKNYDIHQNP